MRTLGISLIFIICSAIVVPADGLSVTGVDSTGLLRDGKVDLYISLNESIGKDNLPDFEDFRLQEYSARDGEWIDLPVSDVQFNGFQQEDISFLLLLDNSGSMYDSLSGNAEEKEEKQRIYFVKQALEDLFTGTKEYKDRLSLYSFNTNINSLSDFSPNRNQLLDSLSTISKPGADDAFTEMNRAMQTAADELGKRRGRKVLILLSDGENYTYSENRKKPHPLFGNELIELDEVEELLRIRGITLYTIQYARETDPALEELSVKSGGLSYTASSRDELLVAYREIHDRINREFRLSYNPSVLSSRERTVRVILDTKDSSGFSYNLEMFWGLPPVLPWWVFAILTLVSLGLVILIHKTPFEKIYPFPHLEVISSFEDSKTVIQIGQEKTMIAVGREKTVIMDEQEFGNKSDDETGITIVRNDKGAYLLEADHEIMVNNKTVISRELEPGDVIRSEGTLIIFDKPDQRLAVCRNKAA